MFAKALPVLCRYGHKNNVVGLNVCVSPQRVVCVVCGSICPLTQILNK